MRRDVEDDGERVPELSYNLQSETLSPQTDTRIERGLRIEI